MIDEQKVMKQLDTGWKIILIIWGVILASLGLYLAVCILIKEQLQINPDLPLETIKYALFGVSFLTLFGVHYLRKFLLRPFNNSTVNTSQTSSPQHPAVSKYFVAIMVTSALLESIGIYGVVLFMLAKDILLLCQLLIISALAMLHFRPRKDELINLAAQMKT